MPEQPIHNPPGGGRWRWDTESAGWVPIDPPAEPPQPDAPQPGPTQE